jgi:hypothetical protein
LFHAQYNHKNGLFQGAIYRAIAAALRGVSLTVIKRAIFGRESLLSDAEKRPANGTTFGTLLFFRVLKSPADRLWHLI